MLTLKTIHGDVSELESSWYLIYYAYLFLSIPNYQSLATLGTVNSFEMDLNRPIIRLRYVLRKVEVNNVANFRSTQ